jgi:hypothetical protein
MAQPMLVARTGRRRGQIGGAIWRNQCLPRTRGTTWRNQCLSRVLGGAGVKSGAQYSTTKACLAYSEAEGFAAPTSDRPQNRGPCGPDTRSTKKPRVLWPGHAIGREAEGFSTPMPDRPENRGFCGPDARSAPKPRARHPIGQKTGGLQRGGGGLGLFFVGLGPSRQPCV